MSRCLPHPHGWVFGRTREVRWSLHPGAASPQCSHCPSKLFMPGNENAVAGAWGAPVFHPENGMRKEAMNLTFVTPAECCKRDELQAASQPIVPAWAGSGAGLWWHLEVSSSGNPPGSSSAAPLWLWSLFPQGRKGLRVKKAALSSKSSWGPAASQHPVHDQLPPLHMQNLLSTEEPRVFPK